MKSKAKVYFLKLEDAKSLDKAMDAAGIGEVISKDDFAAVKIHFGEKGNVGHVKASDVKPVVKKLKELGSYPFLTDANTIYRGQRTDAVHHLMVAAEHEFHPKFLGAPVIIADGLRGNNYVEVEIGQKHFKKVKVAETIYNCDAIVSVAHFKGHELVGFGGAIKNIGMGCAARAGKYEQHNNAIPKVDDSNCTACGACIKWCGGNALTLENGKIKLEPKKCAGCGQCILACNFKVFNIPWNENVTAVQEKIVEYTLGCLKNKKAFYINFLTCITPFCDCFGGRKEKPLMHDIGILLSKDPVAIDQASMDLIEKHSGRDILKEATGVDGHYTLEYAEKLGLGSRSYSVESIA